MQILSNSWQQMAELAAGRRSFNLKRRVLEIHGSAKCSCCRRCRPPGVRANIHRRCLNCRIKALESSRISYRERFATVTDMSEADVHLVRPHIPELFKFLATMLNDANFKISITTLHILEALVNGATCVGLNLLVTVDQLGANKAVI